MHIDLPEPKCSKCGSTNSETFRRGNAVNGEIGRRCLNCGHEQVNTFRANRYRSGSITYTHDGTRTF